MFLQCPAFMDPGGAVRCGLPAHVQCRYTVASTDGPPEAASAVTWFNGPVGFLTWDTRPDAAAGRQEAPSASTPPT